MFTEYPVLRSVLRPELAESSDAFIESVVAQHYGGAMNAADADEFLNDIGRSLGQFGQGVANVAKQAAPHVMNAVPGIISGATTGAALGPWGALAGAAIGGVTSAVGAAQSKPQQGRPPRPPSAQRPSAPPAGMRMPNLLPAAGQSAAGGFGGQIAGLLARPEVQQALMAQLMGSLGRQNVNVGGAQVPTGAVMNMMGSLFQRAGQPTPGQASAGEDESIPAYLLSPNGELMVDVADAEARAECLVEWFEATPAPAHFMQLAESTWSEDSESDEGDEFDEDELALFDDAVALTTSTQDFDGAWH